MHAKINNIKEFREQFSGHETFPLRHGWLQKIAEAVEAEAALQGDDAMVRFGVGKNMVVSMRYWARAANILNTHDTFTDFGKILLGEGGLDTYLENPSSLWLIHWKLANNSKITTTWYWVFNYLAYQTFDRELLFRESIKIIDEKGWTAASHDTIKRDIECFIRTYVSGHSSSSQVTEDSLDSPLAELDLITHSNLKGTFEFRRGPKLNLHNAVFAYALSEFWDSTGHKANTMTLEKIAYEPGSPGRVFKLDENSVADHLSQLEDTTRGAFRWSDSTGIRQIHRMNNTIKSEGFLQYAYE